MISMLCFDFLQLGCLILKLEIILGLNCKFFNVVEENCVFGHFVVVLTSGEVRWSRQWDNMFLVYENLFAGTLSWCSSASSTKGHGGEPVKATTRYMIVWFFDVLFRHGLVIDNWTCLMCVIATGIWKLMYVRYVNVIMNVWIVNWWMCMEGIIWGLLCSIEYLVKIRVDMYG